MSRRLMALAVIGPAMFTIGYLLSGGQPTRLGEELWAFNVIVANVALIYARRQR